LGSVDNGLLPRYRSPANVDYLIFFRKYLFTEVPQRLMPKRSNEDEQTLAELISAHHRSQAKCQLILTSYIN